jgi:hypothetical protein
MKRALLLAAALAACRAPVDKKDLLRLDCDGFTLKLSSRTACARGSGACATQWRLTRRDALLERDIDLHPEPGAPAPGESLSFSFPVRAADPGRAMPWDLSFSKTAFAPKEFQDSVACLTANLERFDAACLAPSGPYPRLRSAALRPPRPRPTLRR